MFHNSWNDDEGMERQVASLQRKSGMRCYLLCRDNTVLYLTIIFCTRQYCSVLPEYLQQEATQSGLPTFQRFPLEQKRREHVQEALVKETGWNDEVAEPEQRGVLSVRRDVCYTTVIWTELYHH